MDAHNMTRETILQHFRQQADSYLILAQHVPATGRRYVVQASPGLYLRPAIDGVHQVGGIAKAERFDSFEANALVRAFWASGQAGIAPQVRSCKAALIAEAEDLRRLYDSIAAIDAADASR